MRSKFSYLELNIWASSVVQQLILSAKFGLFAESIVIVISYWHLPLPSVQLLYDMQDFFRQSRQCFALNEKPRKLTFFTSKYSSRQQILFFKQLKVFAFQSVLFLQNHFDQSPSITAFDTILCRSDFQLSRSTVFEVFAILERLF